MLRRLPLPEVPELAEKIKAGESGFTVRLGVRDHRVFTHYIPEILNGMTLLKLTDP